MHRREIESGDAHHTSARLRNRTMEILEKMKRPMAACEIENWLRTNDSKLWKDVSEKCEDYVRIILSLTSSDILLKFKPIKQIQGIDKRATFFGLAKESYDPKQWRQFVPLSTHAKSKMKHFVVQEKPSTRYRKQSKPIYANEEEESENTSDEYGEPVISIPQNNMRQTIQAFPDEEPVLQEEESLMKQNDQTDFFAKLNNIFDGLFSDENWLHSWIGSSFEGFQE